LDHSWLKNTPSVKLAIKFITTTKIGSPSHPSRQHRDL
jgi:hypothetical protein